LEYAYTFGDPHRLYLNATNRCTNRCEFCVRYYTDGLGGALLWGGEEPDFPMLQSAVLQLGAFEKWHEFIWCGYGEPTFRLDLILEAAPWLRSLGAKIRINTNGHACLINGRDVLPDLSQAVDEASISLNAPNEQRYRELCRPDVHSIPNPDGRSMSPSMLWDEMLNFLSRSPEYIKNVQASVVGFVLTGEEIDQCWFLAQSLGVKQFRVR
jgi:TatD family-associated radical SAM protein